MCCASFSVRDCCCHKNGHGIGIGHGVGHPSTFQNLFHHSFSAIALSINTTKWFLLKDIKYPVHHCSFQLVGVVHGIGDWSIGDWHWEIVLDYDQSVCEDCDHFANDHIH